MKKKCIHLTGWLLVSLLCISADYISGPRIQFPILFLVPVVFISWFYSRVWGFALSILLPSVRLLFIMYFWSVPWKPVESIGNTLIRILVFSLLVVLVDRTASLQRQLSQRVKVLEGFLPICCYCKKIRKDNGEWEQMEKYISDRSEARFSHGFCPECAKEQYPEFSESE